MSGIPALVKGLDGIIGSLVANPDPGSIHISLSATVGWRHIGVYLDGIYFVIVHLK